jgi:5-formyltetrahydrofolate cyclo-ligase
MRENGMIAQMQRSKQRIRDALRSRLHGISTESREPRSQLICDRLRNVSAVREAASVMVFFPLPHEVDLRPLVQSLLDADIEVSLPRVNWETSELTPARITTLDGLITRRHDIKEPPEDAPETPVKSLDVVFAPGLAFDLRGGRLGHGAGMYDRFLARSGLRAWVCGCGFEEQIVERLPMEPTDRQLDAVATDKRLLLFPGRRHRE